MYGYIGRFQKGVPFSSRQPPQSPPHNGTPDLIQDGDSVNSPSPTSTSSLTSPKLDSPPSSIYRVTSTASSAASFLKKNLVTRSRNRPNVDDGNSQFDSLHDLLERAGYKETRVVTPDRHTLENAAARNRYHSSSPVSNPKNQASLDCLDSPTHDAATILRQTMQRGYSEDTKTLPARQLRSAKSVAWLSHLWNLGLSVVDPKDVAISGSSQQPYHSEPISQSVHTKDRENVNSQHGQHGYRQIAPPLQSVRPSNSLTNAEARRNVEQSPKKSSARAHQASPSRVLKKKGSQNQLWTASMAYRQTKVRTAPVRGNKIDLENTDPFADPADWTTFKSSKKRPGLRDTFVREPSPDEAAAIQQMLDQTSPSQQRKWRQERRTWKESLGGLEDIMKDAATQPSEPATQDTSAAPAVESCDENDLSSRLVNKLISTPALPFLSKDPAVVLRNEACLRPAHLSVKRMKSVEVLSKALESNRRAKQREALPRSRSNPDRLAQSRSASSNLSVADAASPTPQRICPPTITLTSPSGITSPKPIELTGSEFEPRNCFPQSSNVLISSRRPARRSKSKSRKPASAPTDANPLSSGLIAVRSRSLSKSSSGPRRHPAQSDVPAVSVSSSSFADLSSGLADYKVGKPIEVFDDPFQIPSSSSSNTIKKRDFVQSLSRGSRISKAIE